MSTLKITGMTCDSCAVHVKDALEKVPGVQSGGVSGNPRKFRHSALWNFLGGWSAA